MRDNVKGGALTEVTFYILLSLYMPKHGYAVMQFIEEKTNGRLSLGAGTLYGALNSLQERGGFCRAVTAGDEKRNILLHHKAKKLQKQNCLGLKRL